MDFAPSRYALAMASGSLQPLPAPWTEHIAPTGHLYYYNAQTTESTYNRPISLTFSNTPNQHSPLKKKKKERPAKRTPVPNSIWVRVLTNRGNVFFFDSEKGESTWDVPQEIEAAVEAMEAAELEETREAIESMDTCTNEAAGRDVHGSPLGTKRKAMEDVAEKRAGKRLKRDKEDNVAKVAIGMEGTHDDDDDEEAWQRRLAEEMAEETDDGRKVDEGGETKMDEEVPPEPVPIVPAMPLEEATQLFRVSLFRRSNCCP
jgi:transcription elongation regulator 1